MYGFVFLFCCFSKSAPHLNCCFHFFSPFTDAHKPVHLASACDRSSVNRISLTFFLIKSRVEVILGLTRIFSPSRNICSGRGLGFHGRIESSRITAFSLAFILFYFFSEALDCFRHDKTLSRSSQKQTRGCGRV